MTAIDTSRSSHGSFDLGHRVSTTISALRAAVVAWNDARVTRNALAGLSDRELEDIGLIRGDIETVATGHQIR